MLGFVEGIKRKPWVEVDSADKSKKGAFIRDLDEYLVFARDVKGYMRVMRHVADAKDVASMGEWINMCQTENEQIILRDARRNLFEETGRITEDLKSADDTNSKVSHTPECTEKEAEEENKTVDTNLASKAEPSLNLS